MISSKCVAQALGRAAAECTTDEERQGIATAIEYIASEIGHQDWSFNREEFRSQADESYAMWISQKVRQLASGAALARMSNYKPPNYNPPEEVCT